MDTPRGAIRNEAAYARGKMLDNKAWQQEYRRLPRNITPSDADMVFDNFGSGIWCEISSSRRAWRDIERGQRLLYESIVLNTNHCAALCKFSISLSEQRPIDTRTDIESFQVMLWSQKLQTLFLTEIFEGNQRWQDFVFRWYENPDKVRQHCFSHPEEERAMRAVGNDSGARMGNAVTVGSLQSGSRGAKATSGRTVQASDQA